MSIRERLRVHAMEQPGRFVAMSSVLALVAGIAAFGLLIRGQRGAAGVVLSFGIGLAITFAVLGRRTYRALRAHRPPASAQSVDVGR